MCFSVHFLPKISLASLLRRSCARLPPLRDMCLTTFGFFHVFPVVVLIVSMPSTSTWQHTRHLPCPLFHMSTLASLISHLTGLCRPGAVFLSHFKFFNSTFQGFACNEVIQQLTNYFSSPVPSARYVEPPGPGALACAFGFIIALSWPELHRLHVGIS